MTTTSRAQYHSHPGAPAPAPTSGTGSYDYRYEFSETRKVLEEFFKAESEFPAASSGVSPGQGGQPRINYTDNIHPERKHPTRVTHVSDTHTVPPPDLEYSLTRLEVHVITRVSVLNHDNCSLVTPVAAMSGLGWQMLMTTSFLLSPSTRPGP